ncbi:sulfite exporter TauE/SafE family protein [Flavobacterium silvaticum]|uniref:Probable membrane transporter protein n=1 Tax=Flavobacterium silvaticum TaxID=1852020 RepID=A0A972JJD5_9FLAO|nr:sulfite exporter TauE/SafE family protein [Flavobacterium silvaticum]NMH28107.1 sulfite exporter TauE/SafE family protein [Flavobacterium silvaticum]
MNEFVLLIGIGFLIGTLGTLIGAGGGFILVPLLILWHPEWTVEQITAISMAVVACNAISGSAAYMVNKRVDYKAGIVFALSTIPGSIIGVWTTHYVKRGIFDVIFGILLIGLGSYLFYKGGKPKPKPHESEVKKGWISSRIIDKWGEVYSYAYDMRKGIVLSVLVGFFSPILGIGGGIIHVPAMVEWLYFPVHIATATSHFILAIMATVTVITHYFEGSYNEEFVRNTVFGLALGIIPGAQLGAVLSKKMKGHIIIRALSVALMIVGLRILSKLL